MDKHADTEFRLFYITHLALNAMVIKICIFITIINHYLNLLLLGDLADCLQLAQVFVVSHSQSLWD